jgi:hypothetical protein
MTPTLVARNAIRTALLAAGVAGGRVFAGRLLPFDPSELPAVNVRVQSWESSFAHALGAPRELHRTLQFIVEVLAKADGTAEDIAHTVLAEVDAAVHQDASLGGVALYALITDADVEADETLDSQVYRVSATLRVVVAATTF